MPFPPRLPHESSSNVDPVSLRHRKPWVPLLLPRDHENASCHPLRRCPTTSSRQNGSLSPAWSESHFVEAEHSSGHSPKQGKQHPVLERQRSHSSPALRLVPFITLLCWISPRQASPWSPSFSISKQHPVPDDKLDQKYPVTSPVTSRIFMRTISPH